MEIINATQYDTEDITAFIAAVKAHPSSRVTGRAPAMETLVLRESKRGLLREVVAELRWRDRWRSSRLISLAPPSAVFAPVEAVACCQVGIRLPPDVARKILQAVYQSVWPESYGDVPDELSDALTKLRVGPRPTKEVRDRAAVVMSLDAASRHREEVARYRAMVERYQDRVAYHEEQERKNTARAAKHGGRVR